MDSEFCTHSQNAASSRSTATDLSQDSSPPKLKHKDSFNLPYSCTSSQNLGKALHQNLDLESMKLHKKAIFKIVREMKDSQQSLNVPLNKDYGNYNRKEKSLGELSKRLLMMFGRVDSCVISLDTVTQQLGVERRRIYDIINILESLGVVFRKGKNSYHWKGLKSIYETIKKLHKENPSQIEDISQDDSDSDSDENQTVIKREKSLGLLSVGFIRLFLSGKGTISLEQAGRKLSSENIEENKIKTKIRRLYDIANVFSSLGLIKKTCLESKKPAYEYIGLPGLDSFIKRLNNCSDEKEIFLEGSQKIKEKNINFVPNEKKVLVEKTPLAPVQPANRATKPFENPALNSDTMENLLSTLINLYKGQPLFKGFEKENNLSAVIRPAPYEIPKLLRQTSSPAPNDKSAFGFATPSIRRSVSIIQRADSDSELGIDKKALPTTKGFSLYQKLGDLSSGKRRPTQCLDSYEKSIKKLHSFSEFEGSKHTTTKSLDFQKKLQPLMWASSNNKYKTSMCKHFQQNGACNLGAKCHFAHGPEELRAMNDPLPAHTPLTQQPIKQMKSPTDLSARSLPPTIANYKTVKCRFFEKGFCKFAQNCGFAHGDTEIRSQNSPLPQNISNISQSIGGGSHIQGANVQNQVVQGQISYLIAQMQAYHANDPEILAKIKQAQEINQLGNYQGAASLVYGIIERNDKSKEDNENYHVFIQNIQSIQTTTSPGPQQQLQQQHQQQQYQPQYSQQQDAYGMSHHQQQHQYTSKPAHNNRQQQQQHHQQSQVHSQYNPYEAHSQSGDYPESPYHNQSYKSPNQNYQHTYQSQGNPYQQQDMQGLTNMMGNFQPYGNQNYSAYQGGATQQGQHRG